MIDGFAPLQQSQLFATLAEDELSRLLPLCSDFVAIEDALLFTEGRCALHLYLVTKGQIALQKTIRVPHGTGSRRTTITVCRTGDVVGWSALVEPHVYTLSAIVWESSKLIKIDAKLLRRALDIYPEMGYKVMKSLSAVTSQRLRQTANALVSEREVAFAGRQVGVR